jgi:hypothetical protein
MAKVPMVTRTIKTTRAIVLCLDIDSGEPCNRAFTLPREQKNEKQILKAITPMLKDEPNIKPVHVVETIINEQLYGMPETDFLAHAAPITKSTEPSEFNT